MKRTIIALALMAATEAHAGTVVWETQIARTILENTFKMSGADRKVIISEYNSGQRNRAGATVKGCAVSMGEIRISYYDEVENRFGYPFMSFWTKNGTTKEDAIAKAVCVMKDKEQK